MSSKKFDKNEILRKLKSKRICIVSVEISPALMPETRVFLRADKRKKNSKDEIVCSVSYKPFVHTANLGTRIIKNKDSVQIADIPPREPMTKQQRDALEVLNTINRLWSTVALRMMKEQQKQ